MSLVEGKRVKGKRQGAKGAKTSRAEEDSLRKVGPETEKRRLGPPTARKKQSRGAIRERTNHQMSKKGIRYHGKRGGVRKKQQSNAEKKIGLGRRPHQGGFGHYHL